LGVKRTIIQENGRVMNACLFPLKTIAIHPNQCSFQVPFFVKDNENERDENED
jgi:hypothetical protein